VIVRQVTLKVPADRQEEFTAFWRADYREALSRQPGFVGARLLKAADAADELQMMLEFTSEEQAAAWRASPDHARLGPLLKSYSPVLALKVFTPLA
jgi:heme-degrading monooxygenase HmoA